MVVLARNAGQHMAILAAFAQARGTYIITLDADLQNPPEEIARLVAAMDAGKRLRWHHPRAPPGRPVAQGRLATHEPHSRRYHSIRITDQGCMLRGYHRSVIDAVNHCTEVSTPMRRPWRTPSRVIRWRSR